MPRTQRTVLVLAAVATVLTVVNAPASHAVLGSDDLGAAVPFAMVVNAHNDAAMLARDSDANLILAKRPAGGGWAKVTLDISGTADIDIDAAGHVTIAWIDAAGTYTMSQSDTGWNPVETVETSGSGWGSLDLHIDLDIAEFGGAAISYLAGSDSALRAAYRPASGSWGSPVTLGTHAILGGHTAIGEWGHAAVAWAQRPAAGSGAATLHIAWSDTTGVFGTPQEISDPVAGDVEAISLASDRMGEIAIGWLSSNGGTRVAAAEFGTVRWGELVFLDPTAHVLASGPTSKVIGAPVVTIDEYGYAAVLWRTGTDVAYQQELRTVLFNRESWSVPTTVSVLDGSSPADGLGTYSAIPTFLGQFRFIWATRLHSEGSIETGIWGPYVRGPYTANPGPARTLVVSIHDLGDPASPVDFVAARGRDQYTGLLAWAAPPSVPGEPRWKVATIDEHRPRVTITSPTEQWASTPQLHVAWTVEDLGSDVEQVIVRRRVASASSHFINLGLWRTSATSAEFTALRGSTYCFDTYAVDSSANSSGWQLTRCTAVPLDDRDLIASAGWRGHRATSYDPPLYQGTYLETKTRGATLSVRVRTRELVLGVAHCPVCGKVAVYLGAERLATISLMGARRPKLVPIKTFDRPTVGTVRIVVLSSGKPVQIDSLGTIQYPYLSAGGPIDP